MVAKIHICKLPWATLSKGLWLAHPASVSIICVSSGKMVTGQDKARSTTSTDVHHCPGCRAVLNQSFPIIAWAGGEACASHPHSWDRYPGLHPILRGRITSDLTYCTAGVPRRCVSGVQTQGNEWSLHPFHSALGTTCRSFFLLPWEDSAFFLSFYQWPLSSNLPLPTADLSSQREWKTGSTRVLWLWV